MTRILIVEDDRDIAELVDRYLQKAGFATEVLSSGRDALKALADRPPDLLILDLMLPHVDGLEICRGRARQSTHRRRFRSSCSRRGWTNPSGSSGSKSAPTTTSPSRSARTSSSRASARCSAGRSASPKRATCRTGPIHVDTERHVVSSSGTAVSLTAKEFLLLEYLLRHRGRVLSRDVLLTDVWGYKYTGGTRTVDVHVRRLREKLPPLGDALVTVKQFGYKLLEEPPPAV